MTEPPPPLLELTGIEAIYHGAVVAVRSVSLIVRPGEIVAVLGANGAGKTTTLKAISHLLPAEGGAVTKGSIRLRGEEVVALAPADLVARGVVQVLEGRHCFAQLTVEENLLTGAVARGRSRAEISADLDRIYSYFPRLKSKRRMRAGYTSGGEQQMTALGRALMGRPELVVLDEPSMGLAPLVIEEIFATLDALKKVEGLSLLIAEQNAAVALRHAERAYVVENGRVVLHGTSAELRARDDIRDLYFGWAAADRDSLRAQRRRPPRSWLH